MNEHGYLCYTYYLYHVPTGKKYYGSRIANRCEPEQDLWHKYFSSSELVEALIKEYGKDSFVAEVRKTFDNIKETRDWEYYVLRRLKAPEKDEWLNQAYSRGEFYNKVPNSTSFKSGKDHIYFGVNRPNFSEERKNWWKHNPELKLQYSIQMKGNTRALGYKQPESRKKENSIRQKGNRHALGAKHTDKHNKNKSKIFKEIWRLKREYALLHNITGNAIRKIPIAMLLEKNSTK